MKHKKETLESAIARRDLVKEQLEFAEAKAEVAKDEFIGMAVGFIILALTMIVMLFVL